MALEAAPAHTLIPSSISAVQESVALSDRTSNAGATHILMQVQPAVPSLDAAYSLYTAVSASGAL